jgi:hypothetical protein
MARGSRGIGKAPAPPQKRVVEVRRAESYQYAVVDNWTVAQSPGGEMELSALLFRNQLINQTFDVTGENPSGTGHTLENGRAKGGFAIEEIATLRLAPPVALLLAEVVLRHMISNGIVDKEDFLVLLRKTGVLE